MADVAGARAVLIGWAVTGVGILALAMSFLYLSRLKPELDGGICQPCPGRLWRAGGFFSAWGYWLCATIGVVGYLVIVPSRRWAASSDTPGAGLVWRGQHLAAFIGESCILAVHLLVARRRTAGGPCSIWWRPWPRACRCCCSSRSPATGSIRSPLRRIRREPTLAVPVSEQVRNTMLITLWVYRH